MREIGRVQCGFFPTQDRIVQLISEQLTPQRGLTSNQKIVVVDAGCGTGKAISDLRAAWLKRDNGLNIQCIGIELDKGRWAEAHKLLSSGKGGGEALCSPIEDAVIESTTWYDGEGASVLWYNPPYDRIRGQGRSETLLFEQCWKWTIAEHGLLVMIVPDYILTDTDNDLATVLTRRFDVMRVMRYPDPEYHEFKQCVVIARRRKTPLAWMQARRPAWASIEGAKEWKVLDGTTPKIIPIHPVPCAMQARRVRLNPETIITECQASPIHGTMLREAMAPAPKIGRPLLPLSSGHLALALAGGLCDGVLQPEGVEPFLIKGSLSSAVRKVGSKTKEDRYGRVIADIETYKTKYEMRVRCLLSAGKIEEYTSRDPEEEKAAESAEAVAEAGFVAMAEDD